MATFFYPPASRRASSMLRRDDLEPPRQALRQPALNEKRRSKCLVACPGVLFSVGFAPQRAGRSFLWLASFTAGWGAFKIPVCGIRFSCRILRS